MAFIEVNKKRFERPRGRPLQAEEDEHDLSDELREHEVNPDEDKTLPNLSPAKRIWIEGECFIPSDDSPLRVAVDNVDALLKRIPGLKMYRQQVVSATDTTRRRTRPDLVPLKSESVMQLVADSPGLRIEQIADFFYPKKSNDYAVISRIRTALHRLRVQGKVAQHAGMFYPTEGELTVEQSNRTALLMNIIMQGIPNASTDDCEKVAEKILRTIAFTAKVRTYVSPQELFDLVTEHMSGDFEQFTRATGFGDYTLEHFLGKGVSGARLVARVLRPFPLPPIMDVEPI